MRLFRLIPFLAAALAFAACSESRVIAEQPRSFCKSHLFEESRFTVCDPDGGRIDLVAAARDDSPIRRFDELGARLGERASEIAFAMNAGMFDEDGRPVGLAVVNGRQVHALNLRPGGGNFHLMPNGVFQICGDGSAEIVVSTAWKASPEIRLATQSGPMLVIGGKLHPRVEPDGQSRHVRNGVGVRDGKALFVISEAPVSFGKLARFFRDVLETPDALYFDGSVSSLWDPAGHRQDSHSLLGPLVVAFKPAE